MKAKINKDRLTITELECQNSGSVNYYELLCEFDASWNGLNKEMVLAQGIDGIHRAVIDNKVYIDKEKSGIYDIGFVGYTIENNEKIYQVSTNLVAVNIQRGAGEIDIVEGHIPTPTEWETYISQIYDMISDIQDMDISAVKVDGVTTVTITKRDGTTQTVQILDGKINGVSNLNIVAGENVTIVQDDDELIISSTGGGSGGTEDYNELSNKPQINNVPLSGNKSLADLGIVNYDDTSITNRVSAIESKIPAQATSTNQLADKAFVNSTIGTNTAIFRGTYNTLAELQAQTATNNDYGFVIATDSAGNVIYNRYKYNGATWEYEYSLNNSSFTAEQWNAINSGVTSELLQAKENVGNKVTSIDEDSTDTEYPSAKAVYDLTQNLDIKGGVQYLGNILQYASQSSPLDLTGLDVGLYMLSLGDWTVQTIWIKVRYNGVNYVNSLQVNNSNYSLSPMFLEITHIIDDTIEVGQSFAVVRYNFLSDSNAKVVGSTLSSIRLKINSGGNIELHSSASFKQIDMSNYVKTSDKATTISESSTNNQVVTPKAVYDYIQALDGSDIEY